MRRKYAAIDPQDYGGPLTDEGFAYTWEWFEGVQAFFRKALASPPRGPRKVTIDGHVPSRRALWRLRGEHPIWRKVEVRTCKYLTTSFGRLA